MGDMLLTDGSTIRREQLTLIYESPDNKDRGFRVYVSPKKTLICVPWSLWEAENPAPYKITVEQYLKMRSKPIIWKVTYALNENS